MPIPGPRKMESPTTFKASVLPTAFPSLSLLDKGVFVGACGKARERRWILVDTVIFNPIRLRQDPGLWADTPRHYELESWGSHPRRDGAKAGNCAAPGKWAGNSFIAKLDTVFEDRSSSVSIKGLCAWCQVTGLGVCWGGWGKHTGFIFNHSWWRFLRDVKPWLASRKLAWVLVVVGVTTTKPSCPLRMTGCPLLRPYHSLCALSTAHHLASPPHLLDFSLGIHVLY